jgi:hypothetical protein
MWPAPACAPLVALRSIKAVRACGVGVAPGMDRSVGLSVRTSIEQEIHFITTPQEMMSFLAHAVIDTLNSSEREEIVTPARQFFQDRFSVEQSQGCSNRSAFSLPHFSAFFLPTRK